ncbi:hypothetical protein [Streptomyces sp. CB01373]|uniref:hypothetical protein n=1 Tax=Streptomyces sp. CB01373 TaxID=2020325 RepID=UPI000C271036|nr:hypothetical protein [Streptomyces sp. CB01373]PJM91277.1 hypothetical protein CG719_34785 [Streptomyces sp. CB01373]
MEQRSVADIDDLTAFLARLAGLLLRSSGEGAHLIERAVVDSARAFGGVASLLLVPEAAALTVTAADGSTRTVIEHGSRRSSASTRSPRSNRSSPKCGQAGPESRRPTAG